MKPDKLTTHRPKPIDITRLWPGPGPDKLDPGLRSMGPGSDTQFEIQLRRYLLGLGPPRLSETVDRAILDHGRANTFDVIADALGREAVDRAILTHGTIPLLDVIEDELIEEYVTGEMSDDERLAFESRFLFNKRRLEKIRLSAMLLGRPDVAERLSQRATNSVGALEKEQGYAPNLGPILDSGSKNSVVALLIALGTAVVLGSLVAALVLFLQSH